MESKLFLFVFLFVMLVFPRICCEEIEESILTEQTHQYTYEYNPDGREEFVFLSQYLAGTSIIGYNGYEVKLGRVYTDKKTGEDIIHEHEISLPYAQYVGTKGYFEKLEPVEFGVNKYYVAVLQDGKKIAVLAYKSEVPSPSLTYLQYVAWMKDYKNMKESIFQPTPLVEGSTIQLIDKLLNGQYQMSNGCSITEQDINVIRNICKSFGNKKGLSEALLTAYISEDKIEKIYFISADSNSRNIELYIGVSESSVWLRKRLRYYSKKALFIESYKIAADDYRYASRDLHFKRDYDRYDGVKEWTDVLADEEDIVAMREVVNSKEAIVRFYGSEYRDDVEITVEEKEALDKILKLYSILSSDD